jgi:F0F1-type ATP synthase assembly protein I
MVAAYISTILAGATILDKYFNTNSLIVIFKLLKDRRIGFVIVAYSHEDDHSFSPKLITCSHPC